MKWRRRHELEKELAEELAFHLDGRTQEYIARGMSPEDAARAARLEFGGLERSKEECRDARGSWERCEQALRLIRQAARRLAATPGFTAISVATLAIGIGASAAVFSLVNGILLKPPGLWEPHRVTVSQELAKAGKRSLVPVSAAHMREWRANSRSLESISLMNGDRRFLVPLSGGSPAPVFAINVSADFFRMLRTQPALGRVFATADPNDVMRSSGVTRTSTSSRSANRLRSMLVSAQVGICILLLVCAGLLLRSFAQLMNVGRGFNAAQAIVCEAQLPADRYARDAERLPMWWIIFERLAALPGVSAVGAINRLPLAPERGINGVLAEGEPARPLSEQLLANYRTATSGYFAAAGISLSKGRIFDESVADTAGVVISENLARRAWPGQDPVGRRFRRNGEGDWFTVLGVVADVKQVNLEAAAPMMVYQRDRGQSGLNVVVRTSLPPEAFAKTLRAEMAQIDRSILIDDIRSLEQVVSASTARRRWQTLLISMFAGVAALLAGLGIWGVVSYAVSQRRNEIGVRMALGASAGSVVRLVVGQGLRPIALGALGGGLLSLVTARALESQLFGIQAFDLPSFLGTTALLIVVAATACVLPARRAARVDPADSLRVD